MSDMDLMGQRVDVEATQRAGVLVPRLQGIGEHAQAKALGMIGVAPDFAAARPALDRLDTVERLKGQPATDAPLKELNQHLITPGQRANRLHNAHPQPLRRGAAADMLHMMAHLECRSDGPGSIPRTVVRRPLQLDPGLTVVNLHFAYATTASMRGIAHPTSDNRNEVPCAHDSCAPSFPAGTVGVKMDVCETGDGAIPSGRIAMRSSGVNDITQFR